MFQQIFLATSLLFLFTSVHAGLYDGYNGAVTQEVAQPIYPLIFQNLGEINLCTLTGSIQFVPGAAQSTMTPTGCTPPSVTNYYGALFYLFSDESAKLSNECDQQTYLGPALDSILAASSVRIYKGLQTASFPTNALTLVLGDDQTGFVHDVPCVLRQVQSWNQRTNVSFYFSTVILSDQSWSTSWPRLSPTKSASSEWNTGVTTLWDSFNFAVLLLPVSANSSARIEFTQLVTAAVGLRRKWAGNSSVEGPYAYATEATTPMYMAPLNNVVNSTTSCLSEGSCMTLGGMSVVATTAQTSWSDRSSSASASSPPQWESHTPEGSVALMVSSSSLGFFHDDIPAAEGSATGILAALLALDAVYRQYVTNGITDHASVPQIYVFFFVGEEYDRIGSRRLLRDSKNFTCYRFSQNNQTCNFPYTTLNFTTVNFDRVQHFLHVEQVGSSLPLFAHVDAVANASSTAQQSLNENLRTTYGVEQSTTASLPPGSPVLTFLEELRRQSSPRLLNSTFTTLSRYNSVSSRQPNLYTTADRPYTGQLAQVVAAAQTLSSVLLDLVNLPHVTVNSSLGSALWECLTVNTNCEFLSMDAGSSVVPPNYYTGVFQYQQTAYQSVVRRAANLITQQSGSVFLVNSFSAELDYVDSSIIAFQPCSSCPQGTPVWVESNWASTMGARFFKVPQEPFDIYLLIGALLLNAPVLFLVVKFL